MGFPRPARFVNTRIESTTERRIQAMRSDTKEFHAAPFKEFEVFSPGRGFVLDVEFMVRLSS
jgi:hypothetical protein